MNHKSIIASVRYDWFIEEAEHIHRDMKISWDIKRYISIGLKLEERNEYQKLRGTDKILYIREKTIALMNITLNNK